MRIPTKKIAELKGMLRGKPTTDDPLDPERRKGVYNAPTLEMKDAGSAKVLAPVIGAGKDTDYQIGQDGNVVIDGTMKNKDERRTAITKTKGWENKEDQYQKEADEENDTYYKEKDNEEYKDKMIDVNKKNNMERKKKLKNIRDFNSNPIVS